MGTPGQKTDRDSRTKADTAAKPQTEKKHPDEYSQDLNPDRMAGQNIGADSARAEKKARTAHDVKEVHRSLSEDFSDDELKQMSVLEEGHRLQQGATYLDFNAPDREEFTATGDMTVEPDQLIIPKAETPYSLWNRLRGVENPERIPERGKGEGSSG